IFRVSIHLYSLVTGDRHSAAACSFSGLGAGPSQINFRHSWSVTLNSSETIFSSFSIHMSWCERNDRRHSQTAHPVGQLARIIDKTIRQRILSTGYTEKPKLKRLLQCWFGGHIGQA
ncbi:unnamed protein product, partial [Brassica oleracea]